MAAAIAFIFLMFSLVTGIWHVCVFFVIYFQVRRPTCGVDWMFCFYFFTWQTVLRLPTQDHVMRVADQQRTAILILKKIAECLSKETDQWLTHMKALKKAKGEEEKAERKAEEKVLKDQQLLEERAKEKELREEKKIQLAKDKEAEGNTPGKTAEDAEEPQTKTKRRRTGGVSELSEKDPTILHHLRSFSSGSMVFADSVEDFVRRIVTNPLVACGARLKKGPVAKMLEVEPTPSISPVERSKIKKNILADSVNFFDVAQRSFKETPEKDRLSSTNLGPADLLALDNYMGKIMDEEIAAHECENEDLLKGLIDRVFVSTKMLSSA